MAIIASCGHEITEEWEREHNPIRVMVSYRNGVLGTRLVTACEACQKKAEEDGIVIHSEKEEMDWYRGKRRAQKKQ